MVEVYESRLQSLLDVEVQIDRRLDSTLHPVTGQTT
jgi:hypothetical protein